MANFHTKLNFFFYSVAVGNPGPQIHWKADGQPIPKNDKIMQLPNGSLQITRVRKADAGKYTCMVNNKYGQDMVVHELIGKDNV